MIVRVVVEIDSMREEYRATFMGMSYENTLDRIGEISREVAIRVMVKRAPEGEALEDDS